MKARLIKWLPCVSALCIYAYSLPALATDAPIVTLPPTDATSVKKHTAEDDDNEFSPYMKQDFRLVRAKNLVAAKHYDEALADFEAGAPNCHFLTRNEMETNWGYALEQTGKFDDAIAHYRAVKAFDEVARLLIGQRRFVEAETVADGEITKLQKDGDSDGNTFLAMWLKYRAAARAGLQNNAGAVKDLSAAAESYQAREPDLAKTCIEEANALAKKNNLQAVEFKPAPPPKEGVATLIAVINYVLSSDRPYDIETFNKLTGSQFSEKKEWMTVNDNTSPLAPFSRVELQRGGLSADEYEMSIEVDSNKCRLTKHEISEEIAKMKLDGVSTILDPNRIKFEEALPGAYQRVTYVSPIGRVDLEYEPTQTQILHRIRSSNKVPKLKTTAQIAADAPSEIVKATHSRIDEGKYAEALQLAKSAVANGGKPFLSEQANVEELLGQNDAAIHSLLEFLGNHPAGPETADYYNRLANLYIKSKNYAGAVEASDKAMAGSDNTSRAHFMRAKAYAGLGKYDQAKKDAAAAIKQYFDKAQIVRRDEVIDWVKSESELK